jgi:hypothetical protein
MSVTFIFILPHPSLLYHLCHLYLYNFCPLYLYSFCSFYLHQICH